jgi:hypothetical protein
LVSNSKYRLANIGGVASELKRCYRMAHRGQMTWQDAGCAARVLRELRFIYESEGIERQVAELAAAMSAAGITVPKPPGNGSARWEQRL